MASPPLPPQILGPAHPDTATGLNNLGMLLAARGVAGEALELFTQAVAIKQAVVGSQHPAVASILINMGLLHQVGVLRGHRCGVWGQGCSG